MIGRLYTGAPAGVAASALSLLLIATPTLAAQRTFVSAGGSDANSCSLAAPCRGFAKAITVTDAGGELVVLDSGGYGSVVVDKSVSIISPAGVYAGVTAFAATDGVTVVAPATKVVLRGLTINGLSGNNGIRVQAGDVHVESTVISNMTQAGILVEGGTSVRISATIARSNADGLRVAPAAGTVSVLVRDSEFSGNTTAGIGLSPAAGGANALVTVERSSATKNASGMFAAPTGSATATLVVTQSVASENSGAGIASVNLGSTVFVRESAITRNGTGLQQASSGVLNACGANLLVANGSATTGSINTTNCLDVAAASGTVISVGTGQGLTGGPITSSGTLSVPNAGITAAMLAQNGCAPGQLLKWNGGGWACANDIDTNSGGTVTNIATGAGLTGGPITTTGTINLAATNLLPTLACAGNRIPRWNGAAWTCADQGDIPDNITLVQSTPTKGNILKGATPFIHNYGTSNTFIGEGAGNFTMTGGNNTVNGFQAFQNNTSGAGNNAFGFQALLSNTMGDYNTAIGTAALQSNQLGINNTGIGVRALQFNGSGMNNTAVGLQTLANAHGDNNTAVGLSALQNNIIGNGNIALGHAAGVNVTTGSNDIYVGSNGVDGDNGTIRIGKVGTHASTFVAGIYGATTGAAGIAVVVDTNGQLGTISSSRRYKDDVSDMDGASARLMQLRPVTFHYKSDRNPSDRALQYGLIAEEVAQVYPDLVARTADGRPETVYYQFLPPMLLNELQKQQRTIVAQQRAIGELRDRMAEVEALRAELAALRDAVASVAKREVVATRRD